MNLRKSDYDQLAKRIRKQDNRIVVYGAGSIGELVIPYILKTYQLFDYVDFFVDRDERKIGTTIVVGEYEFDVRNPNVLNDELENHVILITNSNFYPIVDYLNALPALKNVDAYIIPIMQIEQRRPQIPKTIHYCWFGGKEMPAFLRECIESWKQFCPDYEIICWNEKNYDVGRYLYTKQAYEKQRYGFVSDIARLDILYEHGGIYFDTDVRVIRPLDRLLYQDGFIATEKWGYVNTGGGVGAMRHHPMILEMLNYRCIFPFVREDGSLNTELNGVYETTPFIRRGMRIDNSLQIINGMTVYPAEVFHPYDYMTCEEEIYEDTLSIHYFYGGWMDEEERMKRKNTRDKYKEIIRLMN